MDNSMQDQHSSFPVDRPLDALRHDHTMVRNLSDAYFNSESMLAKINAAEQILMLLETHSLLEERVFYPAVQNVDPDLLSHFMQEHQKTDEILVALKDMSLNDPQALPMFEELVQMHLHHIEEEENQLFTQLEESNLDMMEIGLQMQAYEANLIHIQAKASDMPNARL